MQNILISTNSHFLHFKGVAVFCKGTFPLCSNTFMVMSPMSWQFLLILFSWASIQRLPLLIPQEACTLFQYFLQAIHTDTSSVSEHVTQSLEAVSMTESSMFPLGELESDEAWSPVLHGLSAAVLSSGSAMALVGLEWGLAGSCSLCSELGPASITSPSMFFHHM